MSLKKILFSNFDFNEDEHLLKFKYKMLNSSMITIAIVTFFIGLLSQLGINDIGSAQMLVNYIHCVATLLLMWLLRFQKENFELISLGLVVISYLNITSALIFVTQDEFRMMWFFIVIYLAYMLNGPKMGLAFTFLSIINIIVADIFFDLNLSSFAINTAIFGLLVSSPLMRAYTIKVQEYENTMKEQNEKLAHLASIDHLTGIMNKRIFSEVSERYFETAQRQNQHIHVLTLDLDYFKKINDTYGHQAGDQILIRFVEVVQSLLRKSDIFARVGGEEFMVLVYNTDLKGAMTVAEKIREKIHTTEFLHENDSISITTSIGLSRSKASDLTVNTVLERADKALYQAKNKGRNRVCLED